MDSLSSLCNAKIKVVAVRQELRQVKELWNKFANILHIFFACTAPATSDVVETGGPQRQNGLPGVSKPTGKMVQAA